MARYLDIRPKTARASMTDELCAFTEGSGQLPMCPATMSCGLAIESTVKREAGISILVDIVIPVPFASLVPDFVLIFLTNMPSLCFR